MTRRDARWLAKHLGRSGAALFTPTDIEELAPMLQAVELSAGELLFRRGEVPAGVWIIREGWLELRARHTRAEGVVAVLGALECVGELSLILREPAVFSAVAVTDLHCLFMPASSFTRYLRKNPTFTLRWTVKLAGRVARVQGRVVELLGATLKEQVARLLLHESRDGVFPFAQEVCAAMLGASRSPVNQTLKELEREGVVTLRYGRVEIDDGPALAAAAGEPPDSSARNIGSAP